LIEHLSETVYKATSLENSPHFTVIFAFLRSFPLEALIVQLNFPFPSIESSAFSSQLGALFTLLAGPYSISPSTLPTKSLANFTETPAS